MTTDVTLTSLVLNPWDGTFATGDKIALSYADLDFIPSAGSLSRSSFVIREVLGRMYYRVKFLLK